MAEDASVVHRAVTACSAEDRLLLSATGAMPQKTPGLGAEPQSINYRDHGAINYRDHAQQLLFGDCEFSKVDANIDAIASPGERK